MNIQIFKEELLQDAEFRTEYYKNDLAFDIAEMIIDLRLKLGLTQEELAKKINTKQSSISRLERGNFLPSLSFLERIAKAVGSDLIPPKFLILEERNNTFNFGKMISLGNLRSAFDAQLTVNDYTTKVFDNQ